MFTQPDTLIQNVYDPQLLNRYAFERNNPYKNVDEDGHNIGVLVILALILTVFLFVETPLIDLMEPLVEAYIKYKESKKEQPDSKDVKKDVTSDTITDTKDSKIVDIKPPTNVDQANNQGVSTSQTAIGRSGVSMSSLERSKNIKTVESGGFEQVREGVYRETYTNKEGRRTTRVVYT